MTSTIEAIRAAEAQVTLLEQQLKVLRDEAMADGIIDQQEQAEIDRVEAKMGGAQQAIAAARQVWNTNKATYEQMRSGIGADLATVLGCEEEEMARDRRVITDASGEVDQAASEEDYATALGLAQELAQRVADFLELLAQLHENERLARMTPEELAAVNLTEEGAEDCFSEEYMTELMDMEFAGEGDPDLKALMSEIEAGLSGGRRGEVMVALAGIVGIPPSDTDLDADYGRFEILRAQQDAIGDQNSSGDVPALDEETHPDFRASRGQLMFGKVLGDSFGIHEVFGALLSPTGGLVGPGNELIPGVMDSPHLSPDNPVALHGTVHDAAGYLKAYHNQGPGYNYRDNPIEGIATAVIEMLPQDMENLVLPLTGQISGIVHWTMEAGDEYVEARVDEALVMIETELTQARDEAAIRTAELILTIDEAKDDALDAADALRHDAEDAIDQAEQDLRDLADAAEAEVLEARDAFVDGAESAADAAVDVYEAASAEARSIEQAALEKLDAVANFIWI